MALWVVLSVGGEVVNKDVFSWDDYSSHFSSIVVLFRFEKQNYFKGNEKH